MTTKTSMTTKTLDELLKFVEVYQKSGNLTEDQWSEVEKDIKTLTTK